MKLALFQRKVSSYRALLTPSDDALTPVAVDVLLDLRRFCFADESTTARAATSMGTIDANAVLVAEGRRQVWLRIVEHLGPRADAMIRQLQALESRERDQ